MLRIHDKEEFWRLFTWEVQRATRYQDFLALCLVRPDPPALPGGEALSLVAHRISELLRSTDLVGLLDDMVAVVLVHTPDSEATITMDRLRRLLELGEAGAGDALEGTPGLRIGVAAFPSDATSDGVLLARARARLDEAGDARRPPPTA